MTSSPLFVLPFLLLLLLPSSFSSPILSPPLVPYSTHFYPPPVLTEKTSPSFPCPRASYDTFFACNCHFLQVRGHSALLPNQDISPRKLRGAVQSCIKQFGLKTLKQACMRLAGCNKHPQKCDKFQVEDSLEGMQQIVNKCSHWKV